MNTVMGYIDGSVRSRLQRLFPSASVLQHKGSVRATAVRQDAVLAGDLKLIRLLCNDNLNRSIPSRGSEEKRIRICLQAWSNIQSNGYRK